jgi:hypothetical protein
MKHNGGRRPDEILAEIERTRSDMDATLNAIENRLTPGQLVDQGIDYLRNSGANEFVANLGGSVKHNPLPVALVGIGLAWLMAAGRKPGDYGYSSYDTDFGPSTTDKLRSRASDTLNRASETMSSAKQSFSQTAQSAKQSLSQTAQSFGQSAQSAKQSLAGTAQSMRERASSMSQSARQQVDRAKGGFEYMLREQPLVLGAIGLAIGAAVAAMAPRTRKEDEMMGEARDRLLDEAAEAGKERLERAQHVATAGKDAAKKEAERQGMSRGDGEDKSAAGPGASAKTSTVNEQPFYETPGGPRNLP